MTSPMPVALFGTVAELFRLYCNTEKSDNRKVRVLCSSLPNLTLQNYGRCDVSAAKLIGLLK
jgi:hypothetical protein